MIPRICLSSEALTSLATLLLTAAGDLETAIQNRATADDATRSRFWSTLQECRSLSQRLNILRETLQDLERAQAIAR